METPDYSFLNDYISKIIDSSNKADNNVEADNDGFYNTQSDEDDSSEEGISYGDDNSNDDEGFNEANDWLAEQGDSIDEEGNPTNDQGGPFADGGDTDDYSGGKGSHIPSYSDITGDYKPSEDSKGILDPSKIQKKITSNESGGDYEAFNNSGGGAGAVGKYQFRWNVWKDDIGKVTGVTSKEKFLKSPQSQEKFYSWYEKNYLEPEVTKLQPYNKKGLDSNQLAELIHFRGAKGARKYLKGEVGDKPEEYNTSISKYIAQKQRGGMAGGGGVHGVAVSGAAQYHGLNNPSFDSMTFPMEGVNTFRGLDDGSEILIEDETGKKKKLKGKYKTIKMTGTVNEKRIKK